MRAQLFVWIIGAAIFSGCTSDADIGSRGEAVSGVQEVPEPPVMVPAAPTQHPVDDMLPSEPPARCAAYPPPGAMFHVPPVITSVCLVDANGTVIAPSYAGEQLKVLPPGRFRIYLSFDVAPLQENVDDRSIALTAVGCQSSRCATVPGTRTPAGQVALKVSTKVLPEHKGLWIAVDEPITTPNQIVLLMSRKYLLPGVESLLDGFRLIFYAAGVP